MEIIALCVPWILLLFFCFLLILIFLRKWRWSLSVCILLFFINRYYQCFPLNISDSNNAEETFKVMTFNCNLSHRLERREYRRNLIRKMIFELNPDIIFLTENFCNSEDSLWLSIQDAYPYRSKSRSNVGNKFYSKFPLLVDSTLEEKKKPYGINYCQIAYKNTLLDVFGVHLSSNNHSENMEYLTPDSVDSQLAFKAYLKNVNYAQRNRLDEICMIIDTYHSSNGMTQTNMQHNPTFIIGDFNDVSGSPSLEQLRNMGFRDAWWNGGNGYGATIHTPFPYRIDHMLYNERLNLDWITVINTPYLQNETGAKLSDHNALWGGFVVK